MAAPRDTIAPFPNFRRVSVAEQAAVALREAIQLGRIGDPLPGEHQLARMLGISRSSLRTAMMQLESERLLTRVNGRRARLSPAGRPEAGTSAPVVCLVCPISRQILNPNQLPIVMELRANCATRGIGWEEAVDARFDQSRPGRQLEALVGHRSNVCWVLLSCSGPIQRWFARAGVPTFVLGSCVPGVELPAIDTDYRAVGQHAAGRLLKHGHRRVVLLQPVRAMAGDFAARDGILSHLAAGANEVATSIVLVDRDRAALRGKLDRLMQSPRRPTAVFSSHPDYGLSALFLLLRSGVRVPEDVSLILGDSDSLIERALPEVTRYRDVTATQAARAVRMAQALLAGRSVPGTPFLFVPTFVAGSTLGPAPADRPA